ncbi:EamA family transporter [Paenibacillus sp. MBLB4367]|uniref:EamA family transporter n=1 Tax=Paenibacillus sp. MBLB4367 TaxID=3384767 RepID=UPI003908350F
MWFIVAVLSAVLFGTAGLLMKISQMQNGSISHLLVGLYASGSAGFLINLLFHSPTGWDHAALWIGGLAVGLGSAWGNLVFMKALNYGPASLTSPLTNMNIVLVIGLSAFWYGETFGIAELTGIALLLAAVVLLSIRGKEPLSIAEKRWFLLVALATLLFTFRNGGLKVTEELGLANTQVLLIGYVLSLVWFIATSIDRRPRGTRPALDPKAALSEARHAARVGLRWGLAAGAFSYGGLQLYAFALELGKAGIVAPIFATNGLVTALGSIVLFRERLTRLQAFALACLFAGLVCVRL